MEVNFDGIPGPTHNYSGLAEGNLASEKNARRVANPRAAALQGLAKMRALKARGFPQAVLPPHERPAVDALRALGFAGSDAAVIAAAARDTPRLLAACSSAAAMWVANAATVSPSPDTADGRVHFTPANLVSHFHRSLEAPVTTRVLRAIFADAARFVVHDPLPAAPQLGDEGAANHTRFGGAGERGVELFAFGRVALDEAAAAPRTISRAADARGLAGNRAPPRARSGAGRPCAAASGCDRRGRLPQRRDRRGPRTRSSSATSGAYVDQARVMAELVGKVGPAFVPVVVTDAEVSLADAVATYLFNSQLLTRPDGRLLLVAPAECREHPRVREFLDRLITGGGPIAEVLMFDLKQSMENGGGPACLRLRVALTDAERASVGSRVFLDDALAGDLDGWIRRHYRDRLAPADLADPALYDESRRALDELTTLLRLPAVYPFQLAGA